MKLLLLLRRASLLICIIFLLFSGLCSDKTAVAADKEFAPLVSHFKTQYKARRVRIPFMGLANFAAKIVRPAGVKGIKLEVFEDLQYDSTQQDRELSAVLRQTLGREWRPLVRVASRADHEQTYIYVKDDGKKTLKLMIVNLDGSDAVVVRVKLNPDTLIKWMDDPKIMGISLTSTKKRNAKSAATTNP